MPFNPFWAGNPSAIGQQTRAGQIIVAGAPGNGTARRSKKRKAPRAAARATARRVKRGKPARLVKGSAAAKAHMAKIRRKRRK